MKTTETMKATRKTIPEDDVFWEIRNETESEAAEILLYGEICSVPWADDDVTPKQFAEDLKNLGGKDIVLRINSPGGDVFAAQAIYNQLKTYKGGITARIDGMAASAATLITCAADKVIMPDNGIFMIHNPTCIVIDNMDAVRLHALGSRLETVKQTIVNVYMQKCKNITENKLKDMMNAETWLTADEAMEYGFIDVKSDEAVEMALNGASAMINSLEVDLTRYHQPDKLKNILAKQLKPKEKNDMNEKNTDEKTLLDKLRSLLGVNNTSADAANQPENAAEKQSDPVAAERQRMLDLDAMRDGSEIVDKIVDIAKRKGNTAEEIREYVDQVKASTKTSSQQEKGIEEIKNLIKDQMASGAANVGVAPADGIETNEAKNKAVEVNNLVAAMKNMRGEA